MAAHGHDIIMWCQRNAALTIKNQAKLWVLRDLFCQKVEMEENVTKSARIVMQPASMVKFSKLRDLNSKNWGLVVRNRTFRRFSKRKWSLNQKTMVLPPAKHLAYCTENKPATNHVGSFRSYHKSLQSIMSCAMMWFHVHFEPKSIVRRFQNSARFSFWSTESTLW